MVGVGRGVAFDLDVRDYNLWRREALPVILVLYDAGKRRAYWIHIQRYFAENPSVRPRRGAKTVRVHLSMTQRVNRKAIREIHHHKQSARVHLYEEPRDV